MRAFSDEDRLTIRFMADEWGWEPARIADVYECGALDIRAVLDGDAPVEAVEGDEPEEADDEPEEPAPEEDEQQARDYADMVRDESAAKVVTLPDPGRRIGPGATAQRLRAALHRDEA